MKTPATPDPRTGTAYVAFAAFVMLAWFEPAMRALPDRHGLGQLVFMVLWMPLLAGILASALTALWLTVRIRHDGPLWSMAIAMLVMTGLFAFDARGFGHRSIDATAYLAASVVILALCLRYAARRRRQ